MSDISISVTDPIRCTDKFGQNFISYRVISQSDRTGFAVGSVTVERRYSEFTWLAEQLSREFPGVIVPPLPDKQAVGRFSTEFIEARRRALEKFLIRVSHHEELSRSVHYMQFLQADDSSLTRVKEEVKAAKPKFGSSMSAWFEGTVNTLSTGGKPELEKSAADLKIEEISEYVNALDKQLSAALKHAEALAKRDRELSASMLELGQSLSFLGQSEGDALGTGLAAMGATVESMSAVTSSHAEGETVRFVEPLEEYTRMMTSIKTAIAQRSEKKTILLHAMVDVDAKQNAYRKLIGVPGKESQASVKEAAVTASQTALDNAKADYERVTDRLLAEFESFKSQKAADVKQLVMDFVLLQIDTSKKSEAAWLDLLPKLHAISTVKAPILKNGETCADEYVSSHLHDM